MVEMMKPGSVCVDLAAEAGGNVAGCKADEIVTTPNGMSTLGHLVRLKGTDVDVLVPCRCEVFYAVVGVLCKCSVVR